MFVYNKQKSQRDKELKSQSIESTMLKQVEIDASKIQRVKTSRSLISEIIKSKRDKYKTKQMKNVEWQLVMS